MSWHQYIYEKYKTDGKHAVVVSLDGYPMNKVFHSVSYPGPSFTKKDILHFLEIIDTKLGRMFYGSF